MLVKKADPFYTLFTDYEYELRTVSFSESLFEAFVSSVWGYYAVHKRSFPWRIKHDPYSVIVSEVMLQQTQTKRVLEKFDSFLKTFPTLDDLAQASTAQVLKEWIGLGYNRRALALHGIAQKIKEEYGGIVPHDPAILECFKGLGPATAASIVAFAFNKKTVFIETNIRAVFLHVFYQYVENPVKDVHLMPLVARTVDSSYPRDWYYALMDCGVFLKKLYPNPNIKSFHHVKQSRFKGSDRQIRGAIIRFLIKYNKANIKTLLRLVSVEQKQQFLKVIEELVDEGFLWADGAWYSIADIK